MISKNFTADRNEIAGDAKSKIPAEMANYWIGAINSLISDLTPAKDAGGALFPVDFNIIAPNGTTVLTTTYPQIIPITKLKGGLTVASNLITLTKGFLYKIEMSVYGSGTGVGVFAIYDSANVDKADRFAVAVSSTSTAALSSATGKAIIDLTGSASDLQIKLVNVGAVTPFSIEGTRGYVEIEKYIKIPLTAIE